MDFKKTLHEYKEKVDSEIKSMLKDSLKRFVMNGGKRLRPIAMMMACKAFSSKDIIKESLSVEFVHNSTLIHDDVMDEDEERRGMPTVYKEERDNFLEKYDNKKSSLFYDTASRFGVSKAILDGNILLSIGLELLEGKALDVLNKAYREVLIGQEMDIMTEFEDTTEEGYINMISKKTATLFSASVEIGASLGGASIYKIKLLKEYAMNSALAFQIKDDIIDITGGKGHCLGSDIKQGKKNILIIKAIEKGSSEDIKRIKEVLCDENCSESDINDVIYIIKKSGALAYAEELADEKIKIAKESLEKAELPNESFLFFDGLADYMVKRKV